MKKSFKPEIIYMNPQDVTPYINNAKIHSDEQIDKLAGMISEFGFDQPVVVDSSHVIIKGHGRREAAIRLNMDLIPVIISSHLDEHQVKASRIADNKVSSLEYDIEKLGFDIGTLERANFDLTLTGLGFDELKGLLSSNDLAPENQGGTEGLTDPDEVPEQAPARTKLGNIFRLGNHRLMCGNSTLKESVTKLVGQEKPDMVFTDPPYGIGFKYNSHEDTTGDEYMDFCRDWFKNIRMLSDFIVISTGWAYNKFWYSFDPKDCFYWICKNKMTGGSASHFRKVEPLFMWGKPENRYNFDFFEQTTQIEAELKGKHTCPKPVSLIESIIHGCKDKGLILDIFGGSGTTMIACEKTNRKCFMMELDPHYCDVIIARWENFTGNKAELITE